MKPSEIYTNLEDKKKGDGYIDIIKFNDTINEMAEDIRDLKEEVARIKDWLLIQRLKHETKDRRYTNKIRLRS
jgi:hypothetical protein